MIAQIEEEMWLRVSEKRMLRILGPKWDEVTGEWKNLHNEELNDMYSSTNIVRVIKSRRMRWAGHVSLMSKRRGEVCTGLLWGKVREGNQSEDPGVDER